MAGVQTRRLWCWKGPVCPRGSRSSTGPSSSAGGHCSGSLWTGWLGSCEKITHTGLELQGCKVQEGIATWVWWSAILTWNDAYLMNYRNIHGLDIHVSHRMKHTDVGDTMFVFRVRCAALWLSLITRCLISCHNLIKISVCPILGLWPNRVLKLVNQEEHYGASLDKKLIGFLHWFLDYYRKYISVKMITMTNDFWNLNTVYSPNVNI